MIVKRCLSLHSGMGKEPRRELKALVCLTAFSAMFLSGPASAGWLCDWFGWGCCGSLTEVTNFGKNDGNLQMCVYTPKGLPADRPLVVALHGCVQQAEDYGAGPGWTQLADEHRFALLLPQQKRANNPNKCFNWFLPDDVKRHDAGGTAGEAASIWEMVQKMEAAPNKVDPKKVYVTGLSAGGAMTAFLLSAYPDVFKAGAIVAGIPFGCAQNLSDGLTCMNTGKDLTPQQWGDRVRAAAQGHTAGKGTPRVSIWQGTADTVVKPMNAGELVDEWTNVLGIDQTPDSNTTVSGAQRREYADGQHKVLVEQYLVPGMDHGVSIDLAHGCGKAAPYILDKGLCSSRLIVDFWGI
jgi:poly(hydroxyalkanoate) depolymerase family esterase